MKKDRISGVIFHILAKYFTFFLIVAFVTTCCIMLFVTALAESLGLVLNDENISVAAKLTLVNVLLISLIFTVIDTIRAADNRGCRAYDKGRFFGTYSARVEVCRRRYLQPRN